MARSSGIRTAAWFLYDHAGRLVVLNLAALVLCVPLVTAPVALAGLAAAVDRLARGERVDARTAARLARSRWRTATVIAAIDALVLWALRLELRFYGARVDAGGWPAAAAWGLAIWLMAILGVWTAAQLARLAREPAGAWDVLRSSVLDVARAPLGWAGTAAGAALLGVALTTSVFGLVLVGLAAPVAVVVLGDRRRRGEGVRLPGGAADRPVRSVVRPWE